MALSGSVSTNAYTTSDGGTRTVILSWTATQSIPDNTTTISWELKAGGTFSGWVQVSELRVKIDGTEVYYRSHSEHTNCYNGTSLASGTTTISHNNDGTRSVEMSVEAGIYNWAINKSGSSTFTIDTIPRASSISSAGNITLGNACSIKWTPYASTFGFKLKFSMGSWSYTTGAITPNSTSAYTYDDYTIPLVAANQLPKSTSGTMTATLYTYSDTACKTQIGSAATKNFTVTVPASVIPTVSTLTATMDNSANSVVAGWGLAVAGYTKIKVEATASGAYGSTISSFVISGGYSTTKNGTSLNYTGGIISGSGDKRFDVVVKDSRGRSSAKAQSNTITFYAYSKPSITSFTAARDAANPNKMVVKGNWSFSSVNGKNSTVGTLYYKLSTQSDDEWTTYGTLTKNTSTELTTEFDQTHSYNFKLVVTDALSNSAQEETFVSTIEVLLDFRAGGKGLGIGKVAETDSMEVALDAKFIGNVYISDGVNLLSLQDYILSIINNS